MNTAVPNGVRLEFSVWDLNNFANHFSYFQEKDEYYNNWFWNKSSVNLMRIFFLEPSTGLLKDWSKNLSILWNLAIKYIYSSYYTGNDKWEM
jgi:hypothetical protein